MKLIFLIDETNVCHFKISKNQLKMDKISNKTMFFNENTPFSVDKLEKTENDKLLLFVNFL